MNYLILGNSAAACSAVDSIRSIDTEGTITMVSPEVYDAYGTPLISYVLKGNSDTDKARIRPLDWYENNNIDKVFGPGKAAVSIDAAAHEVTLEDGTKLAYDRLLVATGSVPFVPPFEGLPENAENRFTFLTMDSALALQKYVDRVHAEKEGKTRVVVIGGGLVGAKAAEGLAYHCDEVVILELGPRILQAVLDNEASAILQKKMLAHNVISKPGISASKIITDDSGEKIIGCELTDGGYLDCDVLVTAVGVRPNSAILVEAGAEQGRGIICDNHMLTSLPDVYAAGDLTSVHNTLAGFDAPLALWPNANHQGRIAGACMAGDTAESYDGSFAVNAVGFFGETNILTCGVINPPADDDGYSEHITIKDDEYTKFVTKDNKLYGFILMNRPEGAGIYTSLVREGIPLSDVSPEIFDRPIRELDLPRSLRRKYMLKGFVEEGRA